MITHYKLPGHEGHMLTKRITTKYILDEVPTTVMGEEIVCVWCKRDDIKPLIIAPMSLECDCSPYVDEDDEGGMCLIHLEEEINKASVSPTMTGPTAVKTATEYKEMWNDMHYRKAMLDMFKNSFTSKPEAHTEHNWISHKLGGITCSCNYEDQR